MIIIFFLSLSLSDSKSHQVSRTLLSILADLNNAVVWMVSTRPFINPLVTVSSAPIIIIIVFHISVCRWSFTGFWVTASLLKSPQVSRTLLSTLAVLNNVVVWMVSTRPPTSNSSSPFSKPFVTVPNAPFTIGIIFTCMFHSFFSSLARLSYLSFFSHSFSIIIIIIIINRNSCSQSFSSPR